MLAVIVPRKSLVRYVQHSFWGGLGNFLLPQKNSPMNHGKLMLETSASSKAVAHTNEDTIFVSCLEPSEPFAEKQESQALCVNYIIAGSGCEAPAPG